MTYRVGDDGAEIFIVFDDTVPPAALDFPVTVRAWLDPTDEETYVDIPGADWDGAQVDDHRDLRVPKSTLGRGNWGIGLVVDGDEDLFLGNAYVQ